jgi:RNA polymerase sigma-70 factor (ECF subfamily)
MGIVGVNAKHMQIVLDASIVSLSGGRQAVSELDDIHLLAQRYRPKLLRYIAFSVGDADLADSLAQDCLLKAYNGRALFRGDCTVNTWIFSIANNLIRDHTRNKKVQFWKSGQARMVDIAEFASVYPSTERSPEARLLVRERTEQIYKALQDLSVNQRRIFILKFFEDLDIPEIATAIGMPANTVKTHLRRAVTSMRTRLGRMR